MKYVIQDREGSPEDDIWDERPGRFTDLQTAINEAKAWGLTYDHEIQIVAIPSGKVVWRSRVEDPASPRRSG